MALHLFLLRFIHFYFMYVDALPACMSVRYVRAWCSQGPEGDIRSPRTGITENREPLFHLIFKTGSIIEFGAHQFLRSNWLVSSSGLPASTVSPVLGLQARATVPGFLRCLFRI